MGPEEINNKWRKRCRNDHRDFSVFFSGVVLMSSVTETVSAIEK
jgi:hypothetical protein